MDLASKLLSDAVFYRTYSKHLPSLKRRESVEEAINRSLLMDCKRFPHISKDLVKAYDKVHSFKVATSMRKMQFAGEAIEQNPIRSYNCCYLPMDDVRAFGETLFLLLSGTGVGFSVQNRHISKLPVVKGAIEECKYVVADTIMGWAEALDRLVESYFFGRTRPIFDFTRIRPKGARLYTSGARAPGPDPLKHALMLVERLLRGAVGRKLTSVEVYDMVCIAADCVLSGGIRRSATICLFDRFDEGMITCKMGTEWLTEQPWRMRSNNSAIMPRAETTRKEFDHIYDLLSKAQFGEPGFVWTNNPEWGCNPCVEVSLPPNVFCNLTSINAATVKSEKDFLSRIHSAALLGTVQASYTDFPYLRPIWKQETERSALIGVSMTGVADCPIPLTADLLERAAKLVKEVNAQTAKKIGINAAHRTTVMKPEGSLSTVWGTSSGVGARFDEEYYIRRVGINRMDAIADFLTKNVPGLMEESKVNKNDILLNIPQKSPPNSISWNKETTLDLFKRVMHFNKHWIAPGHIEGDNHNNVSCTLDVRPEEWEIMRDHLWNERNDYTGMSMFPRAHGYEQAPFESITKERYDDLMKHVKELDFTQIVEDDDESDLKGTAACAGGACEITRI
jgi:ribonucleoside-diphosphate reductase alpha chain